MLLTEFLLQAFGPGQSYAVLLHALSQRPRNTQFLPYIASETTIPHYMHT
ncbi:hypothetical protein ES288_A10G190600v1 [Gossypium darwinii]|uniref:Uncharacterized protein n=2 Tax=Gossypium TaxID=3633 RepID=A0A5D2NSA6_GOSTO|nr:hypothetical protein ES288_A10G190600v1 [Gossypium darwinii]TYI06872.1 hypothetical protein ES332_A10G189400v1 [Gossypium tomentosum]